MPTKTRKSANCTQVAGKTLTELSGGRVSKISFEYEFDELQKGEAIPEEEIPTDEEILGFVNAKRNASARSKQQTKELEKAEIEVPSMSVKTPEGALANIVRSLVAQGFTKEMAEAAAKNLLASGQPA